jgi:hypothetical protein
MSEENVEIVQAAFGAFDKGDMEGVLSLCDENVEITQAPELLDVSRHQHGHSGFLRRSPCGPISGTTFGSRFCASLTSATRSW